MSRATPVDNSASVSLFPFLAVLLCTMGALLVVLVAVSRSARNAALRRTEAIEPPPIVEVDIAANKQMEEVEQFLSQLDQLRAEALEQLRADQQRLTHLEDHMRRLQDQLAKLQMAAAELQALEGEHYDDRQQAEREVERLQQLIATTRTTIEELKKQQTTKKRSYALVAYEGPNGTTRRPIYVECRNDELILQPEGVRISRDDLRPPLGAGNPLAAALRAARDHMIQQHPEEGQSRDTEPYPLIVVRPSGAEIYGVAQRAIQNSDFQFGYELVEEDWELKYPVPNPQLAMVEQRAIDQARLRQEALAAAAPRAYRHPALAAAGRFEFGDGGGFGGGWSGGDADTPGGGGVPGTGGSGHSPGQGSSTGVGGSHGGPGGDQNGVGANGGFAGQGSTGSNAEKSQNAVPDSAGGDPNASEGGAHAAGSADQAGGESSSQGQTSGGAAGGASPSAGSGGSAGGIQSTVQIQTGGNGHETDLSASRGADWALKGKSARAVAVRRTIQVIVRNDHLAILSDNAKRGGGPPTGKTIPLQRDTAQSIDEFVIAVRQQIDSWGIAGEGLYWRPVLSLHVGPDAQSRAQDLARLLKNSGLELQLATGASPGRPAAAANTNSGGNSRATRSR